MAGELELHSAAPRTRADGDVSAVRGCWGLVLEHSVRAPAFSFGQKGWVLLGEACLDSGENW